MKVYLVIENVAYESDTVMGVYTTEQAAEAAAQEFQSQLMVGSDGINYDVHEWEVQ